MVPCRIGFWLSLGKNWSLALILFFVERKLEALVTSEEVEFFPGEQLHLYELSRFGSAGELTGSILDGGNGKSIKEVVGILVIKPKNEETHKYYIMEKLNIDKWPI